MTATEAGSNVRPRPNEPFDEHDFLKSHTGEDLIEAASDFLTRTELHPRPTVDTSSALEKARKRFGSQSLIDRRRTVSLLVLLSQLEGVEFDEAAELLGTSSHQLLRWIRGEMTVSVKKFAQIRELAEALRHLHRVLEPAATRQWLHTEIPALQGRTPYELMRRQKYADVAALARSYTEPLAFT